MSTPTCWTAERWRLRAREVFEAAIKEGGAYEAWALKIAGAHAGRDVWVWDRLPMQAIKAIWRDCCRLTQFEEPFEVPGPVCAELLPRQRAAQWIYLNRP